MPYSTADKRRRYEETHREERKAAAKAWRAADPRRGMVMNAKQRAKREGLPCTITVNDLTVPATCPLLGIPLVPGEVRHDGSPSLDKIIPALGYVPGNVRVISWLANAVKRDLTPEQLLTFARNIGPHLS